MLRNNTKQSRDAVIHKPRQPVNITWPDIFPLSHPTLPENNCRSRTSTLVRVGYGGMYPGKG